MTEDDWPDDVLDAAAEHFHVPEMHDTILRQQAQIADNQAALGLRIPLILISHSGRS